MSWLTKWPKNRRLARSADNIKILTLCGGVPFGPQIASLEHGAHIIVGTPGRIQQHLRKGSLKLDGLNTLVLDEADRMLDMGFYDNIAEIIEQTPSPAGKPCCSPPPTRAASNGCPAKFMRDPQQVKADAFHDDTQIEQRFYEISRKNAWTPWSSCSLHHRHGNPAWPSASAKQQCPGKPWTTSPQRHLGRRFAR